MKKVHKAMPLLVAGGLFALPLTAAAAGPSGHQAGPFIGGGAIHTG